MLGKQPENKGNPGCESVQFDEIVYRAEIAKHLKETYKGQDASDLDTLEILFSGYIHFMGDAPESDKVSVFDKLKVFYQKLGCFLNEL